MTRLNQPLRQVGVVIFALAVFSPRSAFAAGNSSFLSPAATANSGTPSDNSPPNQRGIGGVGAPDMAPQNAPVGAPFAGGDATTNQEFRSDSPPTSRAGAAGRDELFFDSDLDGSAKSAASTHQPAGARGAAH